VLAVALLGMLLLLTAAFGVAQAMVAAHRRAQAAADLAALAGAQALQQAHDACTAASVIATANGAVLDRCAVAARDVVVTARVRGPHWLGAHGDLSAQARAGPDQSVG
jgi:secretion/DNA translocation related TadE-like protein